MKVKDILSQYSVLFILIGLIIAFSIINPLFMGKTNVSNFMRQIPVIGIQAIAVSMVMITGGTDLSIGSIAAFSGTASVYMIVKGVNPVLAIVITLLIGAFWGFVNSYIITKFNAIPFISTLATNLMISGLILFLTNGIYVTGVPEWYYKISNTKILNTVIYSNTLIFIFVVIMMSYILKNTRFGRYCYAVGANPEVARLSGIDVKQQVRRVYIFEGTLAALSGILLMSNLNVGAPGEGSGTGAFALAGAVIGGVRFGGGIGNAFGAMLGIITIEVFKNGLSIQGMNTYAQDFVTGLVIVLAVVVDYYRNKKAVESTLKEESKNNKE